MRKHYVDFLSPGTFVSEESSAPIEDWDTHKAAQMATHILERYGARPYAFRFRTMLTRDPLPDGEGGLFQVQPKEVAKSGLHFICGEVIRYDDIPDDDKARRILKANMRNTDCALAVETRNGYRHTAYYSSADCIVDSGGNITDRGSKPDYEAYRRKVNEMVKRETEEFLARHK